MNPWYDENSKSKFYTDLRHLQDDKTVLENPHKGWYYHYIDNGITRPTYRNCISDGDHLENFKGLKYMYLRFDWNDIEHEEGKYDWSYLDSVMDEWSRYGYKFTLRLCCFEGNDPNNPYATPKWVFDAGAQCRKLEHATVPRYTDPIFCEKLENFFKEYARKYNGHPLIEYIDIGTVGAWGEGHSWLSGMHDDVEYTVDQQKWHIDLHAKYFDKTKIMVNDDMIRVVGEDKDEWMYLAEYCRSLGMGIRDDSICVHGIIPGTMYHTIRAPFLFDVFWQDEPVDIEMEHYKNTIKDPDDFKDGFPLMESLKRVHASYAGFHGDAYKWLEDNKYLSDYLANRLGYWFFLEGVTLPKETAHKKLKADFYFSNRGYAPAYHDYELKVTLQNKDNEKCYDVCSVPSGCRSWTDNTLERVTLDLSKVPSGDYNVLLSMWSDDTPVKLGIGEKYARGDKYCVTDIHII